MHSQPSLEQLFSSLVLLLTRHAQLPEPKLLHAIHEHLLWVIEHPDTAELPALRSTCQRLATHWASQTQLDCQEQTTAPPCFRVH